MNLYAVYIAEDVIVFVTAAYSTYNNNNLHFYNKEAVLVAAFPEGRWLRVLKQDWTK